MSRPIEPPAYPPPLPDRLRESAFPPPLPIDSTPIPPPLPRRRFRPRSADDFQLQSNPIVLVGKAIASAFEYVVGMATLFVGLAFLAALPVLQFLSLGYLLEAGARVARSGRLRDCLIGVRPAARVGGIVFCSWLFTLPVRFIADVSFDAEIIDAGSQATKAWKVGLWAAMFAVVFHIAMACAMGGRLRHFLWPFNFIHVGLRVLRGGYYVRCRDAVWDFVMGLRLPYYLGLGVRGFIIAMAWLLIPISLLALGHAQFGLAPFLGVIGGFLLAIVLLYLPFLQMRMAVAGRVRDGFALLEARREYRRAPWAHAFAFLITLIFAVPLYLLKIEIVPREAAWLPGLVFIGFIFPARVLTGWALGRARLRDEPRHWFFRWTGRVPFLPVAGLYVLIVFFTQYTSWNGVFSLYEQHAFLVPVPFFGM